MGKIEPKKFIAHFVGEGEGCDYTIACNEALESLKATTLEAAKKEVELTLEGYRVDDESEILISEAVIYEVASEIVFDLNTWLNRKNQEKEDQERKLTEKEELALLKKLKNKYEGKT